MIEIQNLTKIYRLSKKQQKKQNIKVGSKIAVDHVSLKIKKGEIYGILGTKAT